MLSKTLIPRTVGHFKMKCISSSILLLQKIQSISSRKAKPKRDRKHRLRPPMHEGREP